MDLTMMERVGDKKKMEGSCSTGQSPQWAVVPMEEEDRLCGSVTACLGVACVLCAVKNATLPHNL
jgi:hypothetical protein